MSKQKGIMSIFMSRIARKIETVANGDPLRISKKMDNYSQISQGQKLRTFPSAKQAKSAKTKQTNRSRFGDRREGGANIRIGVEEQNTPGRVDLRGHVPLQESSQPTDRTDRVKHVPCVKHSIGRTIEQVRSMFPQAFAGKPDSQSIVIHEGACSSQDVEVAQAIDRDGRRNVVDIPPV